MNHLKRKRYCPERDKNRYGQMTHDNDAKKNSEARNNVGKLDIHMQNNETEPILYITQNIKNS